MWQHNLISAYNSVVDTWDYIWTFAVLVNSGLTCTSNVNMIEHIGYGDDSTHIKQPLDFTRLQRHEITFPLTHPPYMIYNKDADDYTYKKVFFIDRFAEAYNKQQQNAKKTEAAGRTSPQIFQNNGGIKVLVISSKDTGGAGGAARRMHEAVLKAGVDSVMLVLDKQSNSAKVAQVEVPIPNLDKSQPSAQLYYAFNLIQQPLQNYPDRSNPEMFTATDSIVNYNNLKPFIEQADIIHLHWIDGFFDYTNAPKIFAGKKIVWTLHDMHQFTGGCHYSFGCSHYTENCESCPQLVKDNTPSQLTIKSFGIRESAYRNLNIQVVTPSRWLAGCSQDSRLFKRFPVEVIPNTFNTERFRPIDKHTARKKCNLPADKKLILFGADSLFSPVKNLKALINALADMCNKKIIDSEEFRLVVFGRGQLDAGKLPFTVIQLGLIESADTMPYIYASADFLVLPSIIDNFPNIMCESFACGTPVVGFNIGGLPDLIETGKTGYLATAGNLEELEQGIIWGLTVAADNQEIRNNCRSRVKAELTEDIIAERMNRLYHRLMKSSTDTNSNIAATAASISGNDPLRKRYLNTLINAQDASLVSTAGSFGDDLVKWLLTSLLPHRNLTTDEQTLKEEALSILNSSDSASSEYLRALLYAVVLVPAEELPLDIKIFNYPESLVKLFLHYIFTCKELPAYPDFAEITYRHILTYLKALNNELGSKPQAANDYIMSAFNTLKIIPAYCAPGNLKEVMQIFGDIMRQFLLMNNAVIDYDFGPRDTSRKIRLGILLQAFGEHTETYATLPVFTHLDKTEYEIYAFVLRITNSSQELQYRECYDHIIEISATQIPQSVAKFREADLDILLIGTNVTALATHNTIIANHRLARVQAVHFCNPCTTGIANMDCFITGNNLDLNPDNFTEKLLHTNHSGICFEGNTVVKPVSLQITREALQIPENALAFVTGANFYKFTWELKEFWIRLLKEIPDSYLITFPFGPAWTNKYPVHEFNQLLSRQAKDNGLDPSRIIILKPLPTREDVRQAVGLCDIYLDSFPYSGATSLLDPLHTGVPVICMRTASVRGGQGSSMLEDIGLTELIADNEEEYLNLARRLAEDTEYRSHIAGQIREKMQDNPAFLDTASYCKDMDRIYKTMLSEYDNTIGASKNETSPVIDTAPAQPRLKPNDPCSCGSGLKYKKCCGKNL